MNGSLKGKKRREKGKRYIGVDGLRGEKEREYRTEKQRRRKRKIKK